MTVEERTAVEQLADANPVDPTDLASEVDRGAAWASIAARLKELQPAGSPHRRRPRRLVVGVAALALVLTVVLALVPGRNGNDRATRVLGAVAAVASGHSVPGPTAGSPYVYRESESASLVTAGGRSGGWSALVKTRRQEWAASDGSGRLRETSGTPTFLGERDRRRWLLAGAPRLGNRTSDEAVAPGTLGDRDLTSWSTDPDELRVQLEERARRSGAPTNAEMLVLTGDLLRQAAAPPRLRAALYRAAGGIPGIEILDHARDPAGREGVGIAITSSYSGDRERYTLIFDPDTSALLAERTDLLQAVPYADAKPPATIDYTIDLRSAAVDSTASVP